MNHELNILKFTIKLYYSVNYIIKKNKFSFGCILVKMSQKVHLTKYL
jgi:hypothetical protein